MDRSHETPVSHETLVTAQFGPRAAAYVESAVHASGEDLAALDAIVARAAPRRALDLGCGGGHVAYRLARHAQAVTASDLSAEMLAAVAATAQARGLTAIETVEAAAERLPFADASFDFIASRFSAHHWRDVEGGLREARRVAQTGAPAVFIDGCSPGSPLLDTHLQAVELLRDPSHVRDYSASEWTGALARCGFVIEACLTWRVRMEFSSWIARMQTPETHVRAIRALQTLASEPVRAHFAIEPDGSFLLDVLMVEARAA
ncbi:class I SAM-dependent methyltransferase [Methylobacterium nodulans]|uniref:Methyltransferase type 11 n=1 Tax=Methylobacterium nodulans (strain LMG 21967 / CNCM I-2342 / ORS 2060) TaxID=460265 RepID=B8I9P0_METNO|nr:class I SAM-dependent methyltransferase [Methylobacterium nodulans]ACL55293.1 Methyltransferase type 11 [Methylobacterium nodulans ORS 2060]